MAVHKRTIIWKNPQGQKILQIYKKGLEYALVSEDYEQCNEFVWCKDFLQDIVYSSLREKSIEIYNFKYNPTIDSKPYLKKIRLLVTNSSDKTFRKKIKNTLSFINQVEETFGIKNSIVRECKNPPLEYTKCGVWLFEGDKRWINSPPMLSLYSLFIRVGFSHQEGNYYKQTIEDILLGKIQPYQKKDVIWLKHAEKGIQKIEKFGDKKIFSKNIKNNYPDFAVSEIHNNLGITGFSSDIEEQSRGNKVLVPRWHTLKG